PRGPEPRAACWPVPTCNLRSTKYVQAGSGSACRTGTAHFPPRAPPPVRAVVVMAAAGRLLWEEEEEVLHHVHPNPTSNHNDMKFGGALNRNCVAQIGIVIYQLLGSNIS